MLHTGTKFTSPQGRLEMTMTKTTKTSDLTFFKFQSRLIDLTNDADFTLGAKLRNLDVIIDVMFADSQGDVLMVGEEKYFRFMAKGWLMNMETYRSISMLHGFQCVTSEGSVMVWDETAKKNSNGNALRLRNDCVENAREYMRTMKIFLGRICPAV